MEIDPAIAAATATAAAPTRPKPPRRWPATKERADALISAAGDRLPDLGLAPEFRGVSQWLNSEEALTLGGLRGKVVLVDFWTYSCINCLRTLPYLRTWWERYRDRGLVVVGVHTPEFAFEREASNVAGAASDLGVRYPVVLDNDYATWSAWDNEWWPSKYLVDRRGRVRYYHEGEGDYEQAEAAIRVLLAEGRGSGRVRETRTETTSRRPSITAETYLGYRRISRYSGPKGRKDVRMRYRAPARLPLHGVAFDGVWRVERDRAVAGPRAAIRLRFRARFVHLVVVGKGQMTVFLDGAPRRVIDVDRPRLYTVVRRPRVEERLLELRLSRGLAAYAFTFG